MFLIGNFTTIKNKTLFKLLLLNKGRNNTSCVNGIVVQSGKLTEMTYSNYEQKKKRSRR